MNSAEARLGWLDDRTLRWKLRQATTLMLEAVADIVDGEGLTLSGALPGGAEYACEHTGLPDQYAPLVEAEAVGYLARTLARTPTSLFNGNLTYFVWKIDTLPHEKQSKLLRRTAAAYNRCLPATAASPEPGDAPTVPYVVGRYQGGPYVGFAALTRHPDGPPRPGSLTPLVPAQWPPIRSHPPAAGSHQLFAMRITETDDGRIMAEDGSPQTYDLLLYAGFVPHPDGTLRMILPDHLSDPEQLRALRLATGLLEAAGLDFFVDFDTTTRTAPPAADSHSAEARDATRPLPPSAPTSITPPPSRAGRRR